MRIVNIIGGIGNQMFQYAFAEKLRKQFPDERVLIDIHHFMGYPLFNGYEINSLFKEADIEIASKKDIRSVSRYIPNFKLSRLCRKYLPKKSSEYIENGDFIYDPKVFECKGDVYYEGYWQNYNYLYDIKENLCTTFQFPDPIGENANFANILSKEPYVGIHIRRGDYLTHKLFRGICELDYYKRAIDIIGTEACNYCIFSNDLEWCENNLKPLLKGKNVVFVTWNGSANACWDMYLMSKCRSLIIANSSFSWWAAFLNKEPEIVIAPRLWVNGINTDTVCPPEWERI